MSTKKTISLLAAGALALALSACTTTGPGSTPTDGTTAPTDGKFTVAFSFGQSVHPFFVAMQKGAEKYAEEHGMELRVISADYKVETQVQQIEDLLQQQIDGLLVNPVDSAGLTNAVQNVLSAGVPVIPVDINVIGAEVTSFVESDNVQIGRDAADFIADQLGGKGNVALIGLPTVTSTSQRETGFLEALEAYPDLKLVANAGDGMQRETALASAETILEANPELDAVYGVNESSAMGALSAVQARGLDTLIVGVDATPDLLNAINDETQIKATIAQDPFQMGYIAMELMEKKLKGEEIPARESAPIDLVTKENVQTFIDREAAYNAG
ncbi:MAG: sugar ABC transporter substrate-binding protein [Propionibacteriaceae bacterium]|nr:sugar ABC transporter substrate-binding protein [Propionibacteriaceae bacterium]